MTETPDRSDELARLLAGGRRKTGRGWLWAGLVVVALAGAGAYWTLGRGARADAEVRYVTSEVVRGDLTVSVTATGTVQPTEEVEVSSELSGTLDAVEVDFNDRVEVGQVLARMDTTQLDLAVLNARARGEAAAARVVQAEATLNEARATLKTQEELAERGVSAKTGITGFEATFARSEAALAIAKADLTLAEAELSSSEADLAKAVIRAPIAGIVLDRAVSAGQTISAAQAPVLFTLAGDLARMDLLVDIDEADIGRVAEGQTAVFTVDAFEGMEFPATIRQVRYAPETTSDVVTYKAVLAVDNPEGALRPGMTATATVTVADVTDALIVPNTALRYAPPVAGRSSSGAGLVGMILPMPGSLTRAGVASGKSLWVLRDGAPVEVPVTLGESDGRSTVVTPDEGAALEVGDLVITDQQAAGN